MRQDSRRRRAAWLVVREPGARFRWHSKHRRERRRRERDADSLCSAVPDNGLVRDPVDRDAAKCSRVLGVVEVLARAHRTESSRRVPAWRAEVHRDDAAGIGIGQSIQHDALDDGEDRDVGADGERERQHGRGCERRTALKPSEGMAHLTRACSRASEGCGGRDTALWSYPLRRG